MIETGPARGIPDDGRGAIVTVGTFDGVHLGHRAVLAEIQRRAEATGRRSVLLTFDPHPLAIVRPESAPPLLTTIDEKKEVLAATGLDYAVILGFTHELSRYPPERFVREILVDRLGVSELVIGYDHGFGRGRSGSVDTLRAVGEELGFAVDVVEPVTTAEGAISSSVVRRAVQAGEMEAARAGLGRAYSFRGNVVAGDGRGAGLGFPTANLEVLGRSKLMPPPGVYATRGVLRRGTYTGALHIGPRPVFPGSAPSVELHLLDFDEDIYGEVVRVDLLSRLRGVETFETVDALTAQMARDVEQTREISSRE